MLHMKSGRKDNELFTLQNKSQNKSPAQLKLLKPNKFRQNTFTTKLCNFLV